MKLSAANVRGRLMAAAAATAAAATATAASAGAAATTAPLQKVSQQSEADVSDET